MHVFVEVAQDALVSPRAAVGDSRYHEVSELDGIESLRDATSRARTRPGSVDRLMVRHFSAPGTSRTRCELESPHILGAGRLRAGLHPRVK